MCKPVYLVTYKHEFMHLHLYDKSEFKQTDVQWTQLQLSLYMHYISLSEYLNMSSPFRNSTTLKSMSLLKRV